MKWIDYREKLGIGLDDNNRLEMLKNKVFAFFSSLGNIYSKEAYNDYIIMTGEPSQLQSNALTSVRNGLVSIKSIKEFICKYIAFYNTFNTVESIDYYSSIIYKRRIIDFLKNSLSQLNITYEIITDDDGIFIFPKGVPEMDEALVSAPLTWLKDYPNAEKAWSNALRAYSEVNADTASRVADDFRKALERFFQEFFQTGDGKTLENCKAEYGKYLKDNGVPSEVSNNLETLLQAYSNYMNNYAKHTDKAKINVLEYLMYQTGNIIRLVITLKQEEAQ